LTGLVDLSNAFVLKLGGFSPPSGRPVAPVQLLYRNSYASFAYLIFKDIF
jgi:hypothetical protein